MRKTVSAVGTLALVLAACAGTPGPGESGYPYNLTGAYQAVFVVQGEDSRGNVQLSTAPGGVVSGSFLITDPPGVGSGTVEGRIVADTIDFQMPYERNGDCNGVIRGRSPIAPEGASFGGDIRIEDSCDGELTGTLEIRR
jgi:hypothetical protein